LSLTPTFGFFGLLGGLLGGALGGMAGGGSSSLSGPGPSRPSQAPPVKQEPQEAPRQTQAQQQPVRQETQQPEQPLVTQDLIDDVEQPKQVEETQKATVTEGLLDETKPAADPPDFQKGEELEPPDVINKTETDTPIAREQSDVVGEVPGTDKPDGVEDQLFLSGSNEQPAEFVSGLPDRDISGTLSDSEWTAPQGNSYKQTTTVAGSAPARRYGLKM
jgi:hypothetical protein